jgi:radical SAM-linked protein
MRFTSHLDLHRTWERTFRRAGLPLTYSQGFNPRPRLNLASALPLGFTSSGEVLDAWLDKRIPLGDIQSALARALPPGLDLRKLNEVDLRKPSLQSEVESAEFEITLLQSAPDLERKVEKLLEKEHEMRERRGKEYDLRPLILALHTLPDNGNGCQKLYTRLVAREGATGRPEEIVAALGLSPEDALVHRTRLHFASEGG